MNYEKAWKMLRHILNFPTEIFQSVLLCGDPKKDDVSIRAVREVINLMESIEEEYEEIEDEND